MTIVLYFIHMLFHSILQHFHYFHFIFLLFHSSIPFFSIFIPITMVISIPILWNSVPIPGSTGIGQGRVTKNVEGAPVDRALLIKDTEAVEMVSM